MNEVITKTYSSVDALKNVKDNLVSTGIEQEYVFIDKDKNQVKVNMTTIAEPEILEIMNRHSPVN